MKFWYQAIGWQAQLLRPLSWVYRFIIWLRIIFYQIGIFRTSKLSVPVIIIGNITVGGSGKTPLVIAVARWLCSHKVKVGIITRGYGGTVDQKLIIVDANSTASQVGDEALLLAKHSGCPVAVSSNRVAAANDLINRLNCEIILSDDGLQHYALGRDLEVNVVDEIRHYGNKLCLPAGPLREPVRRSNRTHFTIYNSQQPAPAHEDKGYFWMQLREGFIYNLQHPEKHLNPSLMLEKNVHAVAGIGHPERFFKQLKKLGFKVIEHSFADHYFFKPQDLDFNDNLPVIMTEKDAVKCCQFDNENLWCLPVEADLEEFFWERFSLSLDKLCDLNSR